jgi:hypothetical protein
MNQLISGDVANLIAPPESLGFTAWVENAAPGDVHGLISTSVSYLGGHLEVYYCPRCEECKAEGGEFFTMFSGSRSGLLGPHFRTAPKAIAFLIDIIEAERGNPKAPTRGQLLDKIRANS